MHDSDRDLYRDFCRPELAKLLRVIGLDRYFHRGEGDFLFYTDEKGQEHQVLDLVGGYGASLFGHNHPELVKTAQNFYGEKKVFNAQGSNRLQSAYVARKLDSFLFRATAGSFITTFASTGAEAIEAAMKHSELALIKKLEDLKKLGEKNAIKIQNACKNGSLQIPDRFYRTCFDKLGLTKSAGLNQILHSISEFNRIRFLTPPIFAALEKSFHGKTTGAVQLTHNLDYRLPFSRIGPNIVFVRNNADENFSDLLEKSELEWLLAEIVDGQLALSVKTVLNIAGFFVEPIQGEGGINIIDPGLAARIRQLTSAHKIPLIIDEIQSGMGRTGTFIFSQQIGLIGDYYVFSKSLGGGLAKISALCIEKKHYQEEFSLLHTSTFAEDDFSAGIALRALEMLETEPDIMQNCREKGENLLASLKSIKQQYPDIIKDVRGCGLMLGIEFHDLSEFPAYAIRALAAGKMLGFAIAGYFLHEHDIRVAPAVSSNLVMRIEPSAFIEEPQIARFLTALQRLCLILQRHNSCRFLKYIAGEAKSEIAEEIKDYSQKRPPRRSGLAVKKAAVIGHFVEARQLAAWDQSFNEISDTAKKLFVERVYEVIPPFLCDPWPIQSQNGETVEFSVIGLVIDSELFAKNMIRQLQMFRDKIEQAMQLAIEKGFSTLCLGGYTSMLSRNGETLETDQIVITTGNSLTVGMGLEAVFQTAGDRGIDIANAVTAVVGAAGNIGSAYCEILAEKVGRLVLIGHYGRDDILRKAATEIYIDLMEIIKRNDEPDFAACGKIMHQIANSETYKNYSENKTSIADLFIAFENEFAEAAPISIGTDLYALQQAQIILTATNSSDPVIFPEMIGDHAVIINDVSVPVDTHPSVAEKKPKVTLIRGGIVKLPMNGDLQIEGLELEPGVIFACMTEAILLAYEGTGQHFSYGKIKRNQVKQIMDIARRHGFILSRSKTESWF